jgi:hypothetical protein
MARKRYTPEQIIIKLMEIVNLKNRFLWMGLFFILLPPVTKTLLRINPRASYGQSFTQLKRIHPG